VAQYRKSIFKTMAVMNGLTDLNETLVSDDHVDEVRLFL
jgi:hypothetical protein